MRTVNFAGNAIAPAKIICIGRNYVAHIQELGNETPDDMVVFLKPNSALGSVLHASRDAEPLHYEGELAFIIESGTLGGVGFGLDLTRRELQSTLKAKGLPWERAKGFDGAALFSNFVPIPADLKMLELYLHVDGELRQHGGVAQMIYKPGQILDELRSFLTLDDGDIIMTGTPAGVGEVCAGQAFSGSAAVAGETLVSGHWVAQ